MSSFPSISIIGAGPGGLLLARYLQAHSVPCTIYEYEPSRDHRTQGGSLDLHSDSGRLAVREAGIQEEVNKHFRWDGEQMKVIDKAGTVLFDTGPTDVPQPLVEGAEDHRRPEIDRTDLRNILLDSLEKDTIQWNHRFIEAEPLAGSGFQIKFSNAAPVKTDILIGADGAWSGVRSLLSSVSPIYSGITFIELVISDVDIRFPQVASLVGDGSAFIMSDSKAILPQRNSNGILRVYVALRVPESWIDENPLPSDPADARRAIKALFEGWNPSILNLIDASDALMLSRKIYALPPSHSWTSKHRGITLLGDAAHLMSPFAGEGVNQALLDALEIGKALVGALTQEPARDKAMDAVEAGLRKYESSMWERTKKMGEESASNLELMFSPDSPKEFLQKFMSHFSPPPDEA